MNATRRRVGMILAAAGVVILVAALNPRSLPWAARWLDVGSKPQKSDAVLLLNGGYDTRPFVAAALVHGGWAPVVLLNSVAAHPSEAGGAVPSAFAINTKVLDYGGVPRERIVLLDSRAATTFDEAYAAAGYLADHSQVRRLMIVTEGPHTRRARWICHRVLAGRPVEIVMVSAPADEFDNDHWWLSEAGFLFVVSEYFKLFYYGLRYGWLGCEIALVVVVMIFLCAWFMRRRKLIHSGLSARGIAP